DRPDARLRPVGALGVAAAHRRGVTGGVKGAVAVLGVVVVGAWLGIRVLDLAGRRWHPLPRLVLVRGGEAGAEHDVVRAGAPLDRLVEVIADRVVLREVAQDRLVALGPVL